MNTTKSVTFVDSRFMPGKKIFATSKESLSRERGPLDSSLWINVCLRKFNPVP